jgi:hypothetical protein
MAGCSLLLAGAAERAAAAGCAAATGVLVLLLGLLCNAGTDGYASACTAGLALTVLCNTPCCRRCYFAGCCGSCRPASPLRSCATTTITTLHTQVWGW